MTLKDLNRSTEHVTGIGAESAKALKEIGISTIKDLIEYFPYRYEDYRLRDLSTVLHNERVTAQGNIHSELAVSFFGKNKSRLTFRILVGNVLVTALCFNRHYLRNQLSLGDQVTITGKWDQHRQTIVVSELKRGHVERNHELAPIYHVGGRVTVKGLRRFITLAIDEYLEFVDEMLPDYFLEKYKLLPRRIAIKHLHSPVNQQELKQARRRMVYEEFLFFQLKVQSLRKFTREQSNGKARLFPAKQVADFIATLPFPLTTAQKRVTEDILADMKSPFRMNRLLQGDVGSGKTAVAAICLYAATCAGYQGALMVPTEILAEQHTESLTELFASFQLKVALLTSSVKGKKREAILQGLAAGEIQVVIGTHSLIQEDVNFDQLGLVITDEQHRFGVEQRRILREKGGFPDVLFMTATPIPRTLAITVFGDMDVSTIDELPAGRKPVATYWAKQEMLERILTFIYKEIRNGRQAYVICPLIEESDKLDVQNAIDVHSMLHHYFSGKASVGLMHGRLPPSEKEEVMHKFSDREFDILVSTTVVEVGVNVPNATVMLIYDAQRFGLSQLHQLRGRVGRGSDQSYCILLADPKSEIGKERMRIMTETNDGFELSQKDLELRGPGDFFGKKQSGMPEFKVADMVHDFRALETARNDAGKLIDSAAFWQDATYEKLRAFVLDVQSRDKLD